MKGKEEASERMPNEIEASQLLDIEFKAMVIRKLNELTENYQKLRGNYNELGVIVRPFASLLAFQTAFGIHCHFGPVQR